MRPFHVLILAGFCLSGAAIPARAQGAAIPDCAGPVEIAHAVVVRVERNGALILKDGRAVMLEGVSLIRAGQNAPDAGALDAVRALAMAAPLTLTAVPPKEDRYDRVRVQAFGQVWLQAELLRRGLARVQIAPDRPQCAAALYAAEQEGRAAGRGLWAAADDGVRRSDRLTAADANRYQLVEGRVTRVTMRDGRTVLSFGDDFQRGFSAVIAPQDRRAFRGLNPPIDGLAGRRIRVRGLLIDMEGQPMIALSSPAQIELLD